MEIGVVYCRRGWPDSYSAETFVGAKRALAFIKMISGNRTDIGRGFPCRSLPTSVTAALKKNPGIAIGNVIGNLFNIFFCSGVQRYGVTASDGNINNLDLSVLIASSLLLWLVGWFSARYHQPGEGALMVGCYVVYTAYLIAQQ